MPFYSEILVVPSGCFVSWYHWGGNCSHGFQTRSMFDFFSFPRNCWWILFPIALCWEWLQHISLLVMRTENLQEQLLDVTLSNYQLYLTSSLIQNYSGDLNSLVALHELYKYINKYYDQVSVQEWTQPSPSTIQSKKKKKDSKLIIKSRCIITKLHIVSLAYITSMS